MLTGNAPQAARAVEAARPARGAQESAAGVVAAVTASLCLWRCRRVGLRPRALGRPIVDNAANVEIGDDVLLDSRTGHVRLAAVGRGRLVVGDAVRIGPSTRIVASRYVEIGDGARIGAGCVISDAEGGADPRDPEIWIGDGVTLGEGVRVLPGSVIGAGAVIAAGAVVSGRIPPRAMVTPGGDAHAT